MVVAVPQPFESGLVGLPYSADAGYARVTLPLSSTSWIWMRERSASWLVQVMVILRLAAW